EARGVRRGKELAGEFGDLELGAAGVGDELMRFQHRCELVHPVLDGEDGHGEDDDVGVMDPGALAEGVEAGFADGAAVNGSEVLLPIGVDAVDLAFESGGTQGEADRRTDQPRPDDGDAFDHSLRNGPAYDRCEL